MCQLCVNVFFSQNQDGQVEPSEDDALLSMPQDPSPTAAEKDFLVTFSEIRRKLLHIDLIWFV